MLLIQEKHVASFSIYFTGSQHFPLAYIRCSLSTTGLIGAGTNNARLAGLLRGLSSYYYKEPTALFLVRVAQGLVHMGKGLLTMAPQHSDGQLISGTSVQVSSSNAFLDSHISLLRFLFVEPEVSLQT